MNESFWSLFTSIGHWEFELFLMILFDGILLGILWTKIQHYKQDHNLFHMPYKSQAQERLFHTKTAKSKGITAKTVKEFDTASKGKKLPKKK